MSSNPMEILASVANYRLSAQENDKEIQTELAFPSFVTDIDKFTRDLHVVQFRDLESLRDTIKCSMTELATVVYDLTAYKDLMLSMQQQLPEVPVADLLILSPTCARSPELWDRKASLSCWKSTAICSSRALERSSNTSLRFSKASTART